jgi:hypothetical protein
MDVKNMPYSDKPMVYVTLLVVFTIWWYYDAIYLVRKIREEGVKTICTVYDGGREGMNRISIVYDVDGKPYYQYLSSHSYIHQGEKFWIYYSQRNPQKSDIDYYAPYLEDTLLITSPLAKIRSIVTSGENMLEYAYTVEGKEYTYYRFIGNAEHLDLDTSKWMLKYRKDNHKIAYIINK